MFHHGYYLTPGGELFMMIIPLLFLAVLIYFGLRVFDNGRSVTKAPTDQGLQILNERFAKGEIEEAEYLQKKALLLNK